MRACHCQPRPGQGLGDVRDKVSLKGIHIRARGDFSPRWWPPPAAWPCDPLGGLGSRTCCRPPPLPGASSPAVGPPGHEQERHKLGAKLGSEITAPPTVRSSVGQTVHAQPGPRRSWEGIMSMPGQTDRARPCTCSPPIQTAQPSSSPTGLPGLARTTGIRPSPHGKGHEREGGWFGQTRLAPVQPRPPAGAVPAEPVRLL